MPDAWAVFRLRAALTFVVGFLSLSLLLLVDLTSVGDYEAYDSGAEIQAPKEFYWIDIQPTQELVWYPCYKPLRRECARLLVPLNHLNHSDKASKHAAIALIRIPSSFSSPTSKPHPRYRGPILFNPGGPGGSGVDLLHRVGDLLAQILGNEFDLVSFDPRGVSRSTPKVSFFDPPGRGEREVWDQNIFSVIRGGASDPFRNITGEGGDSLESTWARAVASNKLAKERGGEWLGNTNTEQTAYDMLSIIKAYGRDKLMYWGFSYGTVLGSTFASLFPDKVERIILDGVVDVDNYYATLWSNNLLDTPKTMSLFFETCHAAGSSCPFWAPSPKLIAANLTRIYEDLITEPIPLRTSTSYGFLDFSRVRTAVFSMLYSPWATWPILAQALADLGGPERDPELMWRLTEIPTFKCSCSGSCNDKDAREQELEASVRDAQSAILCSDGLDVPPDLVSARSYFNNLGKESDWADVWAKIRLSCAGWPKVKKGYQGPVGGNTSFPLLFIGNTADPVTPVAHARTMSTRFPGSRVLTQDSPGHCSINAPSVCTLSHVREYFLSGKLPPEGTVCSVDSPPFPDAMRPEIRGPAEHIIDKNDERMKIFIEADSNADAELQRTRDAIHELSKAWKPFNRAFL